MKHRKETQEYNSDVFKQTDLDNNGYLDWKDYIGMVKISHLNYNTVM